MNNKLSIKELRYILNNISIEKDDYLICINLDGGDIVGDATHTSLDDHAELLDIFTIGFAELYLPN